MQKNAIVIIAGPTASGKSSLAIDVAAKIDGIVVNADSMQVYKDTPILSAMPTEEEKNKVPHVLYEVFESSYNGNVVEWLSLAVEEIKKAWVHNKTPVLTGGTGLYIDNLINGTTPIPETGVEAKKKVAELVEKDLETAYKELQKVDPVSFERIKAADTTRIRRALEVYFDTGIPISEWHKKPMIKQLPEAHFVVVKIVPNVKELDERIYNRFDQMVKEGAVEEVKRLADKKVERNLPAMKALGVPELLDYIDGKTSLEEAMEFAKLHSRQYAKRQRTWFNNKLKADVTLGVCYKDNMNIVEEIASLLKRL